MNEDIELNKLRILVNAIESVDQEEDERIADLNERASELKERIDELKRND